MAYPSISARFLAFLLFATAMAGSDGGLLVDKEKCQSLKKTITFQDEHGVDCTIDLNSIKSCQEANVVFYTDAEGLQREIYVPPGTLGTAWGHVENERWDELAKFEDYGESHSLCPRSNETDV